MAKHLFNRISPHRSFFPVGGLDRIFRLHCYHLWEILILTINLHHFIAGALFYFWLCVCVWKERERERLVKIRGGEWVGWGSAWQFHFVVISSYTDVLCLSLSWACNFNLKCWITKRWQRFGDVGTDLAVKHNKKLTIKHTFAESCRVSVSIIDLLFPL